MNTLTIPELYCPFPSQVNKYVDVLEDYALEWVRRFDLLANESSYQRLIKSKFFLLAAGAYPYCELEELKIAIDWLNWVFIWDDQCDLSDLGKQPEALRAFHERFLEILNGAETKITDVSLSYALYELRQRTLQAGSIEFFHRLVLGFEEWFHGYEQESSIRAKGIVPDINTYMRIRRSSVGVNIFITLTEFCNHLMIPDFILKHNIIKNLKLITGCIIAWCNDIFSVNREISSGDVHNMVFVLHYQKGISLEEAIELTVKMHNQKVMSMINLEKSIPSFGTDIDTELAKYLLGLHCWIRSNLDWYFSSGRYDTIESLELVKQCNIPEIMLISGSRSSDVCLKNF